MKLNRGGMLLVAALLLGSAGVVWQQRKKPAQQQAEVAGAPSGNPPALPLAPSPITGDASHKSSTTGAAGQNKSSSLLNGPPTVQPAISPDPNNESDRSAAQDPADSAVSKSGKAMPLEPLISPSGKQSLIARDGTPLRIELSPGEPASSMELQAWTNDQVRDAQGQYDWRFKIRVPAGGLVERLDPAVFTAPENGYAAEFDYAMDQALPRDRWANSLGKSFFVHFNNNTYALVNVQMVAGGAHFVTLKAWLNPAAGSRNLQPPPPPPVKHR